MAQAATLLYVIACRLSTPLLSLDMPFSYTTPHLATQERGVQCNASKARGYATLPLLGVCVSAVFQWDKCVMGLSVCMHGPHNSAGGCQPLLVRCPCLHAVVSFAYWLALCMALAKEGASLGLHSEMLVFLIRVPLRFPK